MRNRELQKKKANKFKKLRNTIMASFQAKINWKRQRKRKNKIYRLVSFLPDPELRIPENQQKKIKKLKNTITA